jgi:hypothetical protein
MSTATVSASSPPERAGVCPPGATLGAGDGDGEAAEDVDEPFGLIDTGLPGAGRRGVGEEDDGEVPTVVVGASASGALGFGVLGFGAEADPFAAGPGFGPVPAAAAACPFTVLPLAAGAGFGVVPPTGPADPFAPAGAGLPDDGAAPLFAAPGFWAEDPF